MKIANDGTAKLEKGEVRIGNFFVKREDNGHIKVQDINSVFGVRVDERIPIGIWLVNMWERAKAGDEDAIKTLKVYISTQWSHLSVAPDDEYISNTLKGAEDALKRHPDWYGIKDDATDEEDAEALEEVKEMSEFEEDVKKALEKEKEDGGKEE